MTEASNQLIRFKYSEPISIGTIEGTEVLDGLNVADFGNQVLEFLKDKSGVHLLLNFENVRYMSSAALTELLRINKALHDSKGSVRLCNLSCDIRKVFQITNLDKLFAIHDEENVEAATQRFERSLAIAADEDAWAGQDLGA